MAKDINKNQKLGEIVSIFPGAAEIFQSYKIDYCCGGNVTLAVALKDNEVLLEHLEDMLNLEYETFINSSTDYIDWRKENPAKLIKHILNIHHDFTKKELRELDALVFKIMKVHYYEHGEELIVLHKLFGNLKIELEQHLVKEEEKLFPMILEYEAKKDKKILEEIVAFIKETEAEHDAAGDILKEIEKITDDFQAPIDACTTYRLVFSRLKNLEKDLFTHIYLENSVLFNMFKVN